MPLLQFLGIASLFLACLYSIYYLLFRKEAFHQLNRVMLLLIIVGTLGLPLLPAPNLGWKAQNIVPAVTETKLPDTKNNSTQALPFTIEKGDSETVQGKEYQTSGYTRSTAWWLSLIYLSGLTLFTLHLLFQLFQAARLLSNGHWSPIERGWLVTSEESQAPFTFWNIIFLPTCYEHSSIKQHIMEHECTHQRQWHSVDLLVAELFCALLWFHPAAWWLNRALRAQLEHIADEAALRSGLNRKGYQYSLLHLASRDTSFRLANQFNQSLIKTRIVMMNAKKSPEHYKLKYLSIFPLALLLVFAFNDAQAQTETQEEKPSAEVIEVAPRGTATMGTAVSAGSGSSEASASEGSGHISGRSVGSGRASSSTTVKGSARTSTSGISQSGLHEAVFVAIGAEFPVERLPKLEKDLEKQGILLNIEELDYNPDKLITRIKLSVRTTDGNMNGNGFSYNDGDPIDEPIVFYVRRGEGQNGFGIFTGKATIETPAEVRKVVEKMKNGYFVGKL